MLAHSSSSIFHSHTSQPLPTVTCRIPPSLFLPLPTHLALLLLSCHTHPEGSFEFGLSSHHMTVPSPFAICPLHCPFSDLSLLPPSSGSTIFNISLHSQFLPLSLHFCLKAIHISLSNHFKPRVAVRQLLIALVLCCQRSFRLFRLRSSLSHLKLPSSIATHISGLLLHSRKYWISSCLGVPCIFTLNLTDVRLHARAAPNTQPRSQPLFHIAPLSLVTSRASSSLLRHHATMLSSPLFFDFPASDLLVAHLLTFLS